MIMQNKVDSMFSFVKKIFGTFPMLDILQHLPQSDHKPLLEYRL